MQDCTHGLKELFDPKIQKVRRFKQCFWSTNIDCSTVEELLTLEEQEVPVDFKFGVVLALADQTSDDEMLANEEEAGGEDFRRFLALLGQRIRLKGWTGFRGGLDVHGAWAVWWC